MKSYYLNPSAEVTEINSEKVLCASGSNEDFGRKPGSYDFLEPFDNAFKAF